MKQCDSPPQAVWRWRSWLASLVLWTIPGLYLAQSPYPTPQVTYPLDTWRWLDLPQIEGKGVRFLHEYQPQKVWFATNDGLLRYDGYRYEAHGEAQGLRGNPVHLVKVSAGGVTVAATDYGIYRYEAQDTWRPILEWTSPGAVSYLSISELSGQRLMIGTSIGALCLRLGAPPQVYTDPTQAERVATLLPQAQILRFPAAASELGAFTNVSDVLEASDGSLWFAVSLYEEDQGYLLHYRPQADQADEVRALAEATIHADGHGLDFGGNQKLLEARDGRIWVINDSYRIGVYLYDGQRWTSMSLGQKFGGDEYATSICQTSQGHIWISGLGKLYRFDGTSWCLFQAPRYKVPGNKMLLFPAQNGSLWVMGLKSRIALADHSQQRWVAYPGLNYQDESAAGFWFLDRYGQVVLQQDNRWLAYDVSHGLIDAPVRVFVTRQGQVWAAGSHQGMAATAYLDPAHGRWQRQVHPQLSWGIDYRAVFEDRDGALWFGGSVDLDRDKGHRGGLLQLLDPPWGLTRSGCPTTTAKMASNNPMSTVSVSLPMAASGSAAASSFSMMASAGPRLRKKICANLSTRSAAATAFSS